MKKERVVKVKFYRLMPRKRVFHVNKQHYEHEMYHALIDGAFGNDTTIFYAFVEDIAIRGMAYRYNGNTFNTILASIANAFYDFISNFIDGYGIFRIIKPVREIPCVILDILFHHDFTSKNIDANFLENLDIDFGEKYHFNTKNVKFKKFSVKRKRDIGEFRRYEKSIDGN